jgi:hypothetical protein
LDGRFQRQRGLRPLFQSDDFLELGERHN